MAKKLGKSRSNRNAAATTTKVQTKKNLKFRVRSLKDLQVTKDKKEKEKDDEAKVNSGSDCEVIEIPDEGSHGSLKRSLVAEVEEGYPHEPKIPKTDATRSKTAPRPFVASQGYGRGVAATSSLSSVQVLGVDLFFRHHSSTILFKTDSVLELLGKSLPLAPHSLRSVVSNNSNSSSAAQHSDEQDTLRRSFISWKSLRAVLDSGLLDLAIRDTLLASKESTATVPTIVGDTVIFDNTEVKFKVRGGKIFLEILSAFTILDRLHDALNGTWTMVDSLLAGRGLSQKEAFKKRGSASGRSYLTLEAFAILAEESRAVVEKEARVMMEQVGKLVKKKDALCKELEQTVEMIIRTSCITPREGREKKEGTVTLGHRSCSNHGCGRGYHFVLQCCSTAHTIRLGEVEVGCIRKGDNIYLEKCAAFGALGRMFVIRCSDYRRVDRILGGAVEKSFLFEQDETCGGRKRRTHISLAAFTILVDGGFADPTRRDSLHQSLAKVAGEGLPLCAGQTEEMIDLSESDAEKEVKQELDVVETLSVRRRISSDNLSTSEDDTLTDHEDFCSMLGQQIPFRLAKEQVYLGTTKVLALINAPSLVHKSKKAIDTLLEAHGISLDDAFCYEGRQRGYISTSALRVILKSEPMAKFAERDVMLEAISNIESSATSLCESLTLPLNAFSSELRFRSLGGSIYLDLRKLVRTANLFPDHQTSKINLYISKILAERGVDVAACFLRQGKSKFAFIRLDAAITLLRCESSGHQEELITTIVEALKERGIHSERSILDKGIKIFPSFPSIQYKLIDRGSQYSELFLHRKTCFDGLQLEGALLATKKGYGAINSILSMAGMEPSLCYQSSRNQRYGYISCLALLRILESKEPLIVCLPIKDRFYHGLLERIQNGAVEELHNPFLEVGGDKIEVLVNQGILFLNRNQAFVLAGLEGGDALAEFEDPSSALEERGLRTEGCFLQRGEDRFGWISLVALLTLLTMETEVGSARDIAGRDLLTSVATHEPWLRQQIAVDNFRHSVLTTVLNLYTARLARETGPSLLLTESSENETSDSDGTGRVRTSRNPSSSSDHVVPSASCPPSPAGSLGLHSPTSSCLPSPTGSSVEQSLEASHPTLTLERYKSIRDTILEAAGGLGGHIGDWEVVQADSLTRLCIRAGHGASKKISFLRSSFVALFSYTLVLGPRHASLNINDSSIPSDVLTTLLEREEREGTLSFLYQLISLRPCFGCFSPELVETVRQWDNKTASNEKVFIDSSFIGSSGSGRTYAGTVRSQDCGLLAQDRVSDCCQQCRLLAKLTINRSLLGDEENKGERKEVKGEEAGQKSVWQLATTTEDRCSFVALQLQSFNTSLPHAFNSASQATAVVEHRAEITNSLKVEIHLAGRRLPDRCLPTDFQRDRQLGPLLDFVARLRLCVGYPAYQLVSQAKYLLGNLSRLRPDLQKLFSMLTVDSKFSFSEGEGEEMRWGTIRSGNCQTAAEQGADICHQCRLLQEPVEFLTIP